MSDIYIEGFDYPKAAKEAGCEGTIERKNCPGKRAYSQGSGTLIALSQCLQCRQKNGFGKQANSR